MKKFFLKIILCVGALLAVFLLLLNIPSFQKANSPVFGVTFTPTYAESLGLDWRAAYTAILDDLGVRRLRLSAPWNEVEPIDNTYTFDALDFQMDQAALRGAKVILGIGRKLPRWPECHDPEWTKELPKQERSGKVLENIRVLVERYKNHTALSRWQVENEVLFPFGICPNGYDLALLRKEIELARSLDESHEIIVTDSGEWTLWVPLGFIGDALGISMYREAWNGTLNIHIPFPIKEGWYQLRAFLLSPWKKNIIVTELQAEPWAGMPVDKLAPQEALKWMPLEKIKNNIQFARNVGFSEVYLWGVEWWYALREQGYPEVWDFLKEIFYSFSKK